MQALIALARREGADCHEMRGSVAQLWGKRGAFAPNFAEHQPQRCCDQGELAGVPDASARKTSPMWRILPFPRRKTDYKGQREQQKDRKVQIRFDQLRHDPALAGAPCQFACPIRVIEATDPAEVDKALAALDDARAEGYWLAGYASYELGYALEPKLAPLMPDNRQLPLLRFGVYDGPQVADDLPVGRVGQTVGLGPLRPAGMRRAIAQLLIRCMKRLAQATFIRPT